MNTPQVATMKQRRIRKHVLKIVEERHGAGVRFRISGLYDAAGKRIRRTFQKRGEAQAFLDGERIKRENLGERAKAIPGWLHEQAVAAHELLKESGKSLIDAARFYLEHQQQRAASVTVKEAVAALIENRRRNGLSVAYLKELEGRLGRFAADFGARLLCEITTAEIDDWIAALGTGPQTANHYRRVTSLLFNFGAKRGWMKENPAAKIDVRKVVTGAPPIFTVAEAHDLLRAAAENDAELVPFVAIGLFAGLRIAEVARLDWQAVNLQRGFIEVAADKAKTARRRLVPVEANLRAWLAPFASHTGPVTPENARKRLDVVRRAAGFRETANCGRDATGLKEWPNNGLRHSYASYHLAHGQDAARTSLHLGHTGPDLLFNHYRELVTPEQGAAYFEIMPTTGANIVPMMEATA
jgi:integrase